MTLRETIIDAIGPLGARTASEIAAAVKHDPYDVQRTLHAMDDAGDVSLRNGFYRLTEWAKRTSPDGVSEHLARETAAMLASRVEPEAIIEALRREADRLAGVEPPHHDWRVQASRDECDAMMSGKQ